MLFYGCKVLYTVFSYTHCFSCISSKFDVLLLVEYCVYGIPTQYA